MYMHGLHRLRGLGYVNEEGLEVADTPSVYYSGVTGSNIAPTDNADWTKLVGTAITTWGNFAVAKTQADANVKTAPYGLYSRYTPFGTPIGTPLQPIGYTPPISSAMILLGAVAIAAYLLLKR